MCVHAVVCYVLSLMLKLQVLLSCWKLILLLIVLILQPISFLNNDILSVLIFQLNYLTLKVKFCHSLLRFVDEFALRHL